MGLLIEAAKEWSTLHNIRYILDIGKRGKLTRIELSFLDEEFFHIAGMQYARDIDFGIRRSEYHGKNLISALLTNRMDDSKIEASRNWNTISGRLTAIINLQATLDGDFTIMSFNRSKVKGYSQIDARFVIQSAVLGDIYFIFLDEQSGRYFCKSAFKKENTDYSENQSVMTVLQKTKITDNLPKVIYTRDGYVAE